MRDASVLPEKLLFDNIDGTCTTKEICILQSVLPDKLCYKYNILCQCYQTNFDINITYLIYFHLPAFSHYFCVKLGKPNYPGKKNQDVPTHFLGM